jgi:hypothetical protein
MLGLPLTSLRAVAPRPDPDHRARPLRPLPRRGDRPDNRTAQTRLHPERHAFRGDGSCAVANAARFRLPRGREVASEWRTAEEEPVVDGAQEQFVDKLVLGVMARIAAHDARLDQSLISAGRSQRLARGSPRRLRLGAEMETYPCIARPKAFRGHRASPAGTSFRDESV